MRMCITALKVAIGQTYTDIEVDSILEASKLPPLATQPKESTHVPIQ